MQKKRQMKIFSHSFLFILLFSWFQTSVIAQDEGYKIDVTIEGISDSVCYLGYYYGDKRYIRDTSEVKNQSVVFQGDEKIPGGIYFVYTPNLYFEVIINKDQKFSIHTNTGDFVKNMQVNGSLENELFRDLRVYVSERQQKAGALNKQLKDIKDEAKKASIIDQLKAIENDVKEYQQGIVEKYPDKFVAAIIKATQKPEVPEPPKDENGKVLDPEFQFKYYKSHFFDGIDFTDERYLRTNFFHSKIMEYMDKLTHQHPDSITKAAKYLINKARGSEDMFRYLVVRLTSKYETSEVMGMDAVFVDLAEEYYLSGKASWADTTVINKIKTKVAETKPNLIGKKAPQMILYDSLKRPVPLHSIKSKFLVLYFFDPDCSHCRKSIPKLQEVYPSLKDKGAEVVSICTVPEIDPFKEFVNEFDLNWITLIDFQYQRKPYNIFATPVIYVLDENKKIIAKRLDADQLSGFLDHQLKIEKASIK